MVYIVTKEVMSIYIEQNKNSKRTTIPFRFECALRISLMKTLQKIEMLVTSKMQEFACEPNKIFCMIEHG